MFDLPSRPIYLWEKEIDTTPNNTKQTIIFLNEEKSQREESCYRSVELAAVELSSLLGSLFSSISAPSRQIWRSSPNDRFLTASFARCCSALRAQLPLVLLHYSCSTSCVLYCTQSCKVCIEIPVSAKKLHEIISYLTKVSIYPLPNVADEFSRSSTSHVALLALSCERSSIRPYLSYANSIILIYFKVS